jgi:hypothetical protein
MVEGLQELVSQTSGFQSLHPFDVVSEGDAHDTVNFDHQGNRNFERLVWNNIPLWQASRSEDEQEYIYESIVASVQQDGGRFLQFCNEWRPRGRRAAKTEDEKDDSQNVRWILKAMTQDAAEELVRVTLEKMGPAWNSRSVPKSILDRDEPIVPDEPMIVSPDTQCRTPLQDLGNTVFENLWGEFQPEECGSFQKSRAPILESPLIPRPQLTWTFSPIQFQQFRPRPQTKRNRSMEEDDEEEENNDPVSESKYQHLVVEIENHPLSPRNNNHKDVAVALLPSANDKQNTILSHQPLNSPTGEKLRVLRSSSNQNAAPKRCSRRMAKSITDKSAKKSSGGLKWKPVRYGKAKTGGGLLLAATTQRRRSKRVEA